MQERDPNLDVTIRAAGEADISDLLDLLEEVAREGRWIATELPFDREARRKRWLEQHIESDKGEFFVAESAGEVVGSGSVHEMFEGVVYLGMTVRSDRRRRGVGTKILKACIDWARDKGAHKVALEVWPDNQAAIALYEKLGFEREGLLRAHYRRKNGELWDSLVMGLRLPENAKPPNPTTEVAENVS